MSVLYKKFLSVIKSLPTRLVIAILLGWLLSDYFSAQTIRHIYTISFFIRDLLMFIIPFVVFSCLWSSFLSFKNSPVKLILYLFCFIILSHCASSLLSYTVSRTFLPFMYTNILTFSQNSKSSIYPLWIMNFKPLSPDKALIAGIIIGLITNFFTNLNFLKTTAFKM
ncbi:MAG: hypothetical protein ACTSXG_03830, partial [Alphaproteobacteria bacterium]